MPTLQMVISEQAYTELTRTATERHQSIELLVQDALDSFLQRPEVAVVDDIDDLAVAVSERWEKIRREARVWRALPDAIRRQYGADFVAVHNGEVFDQDRDRAALQQRIARRFGDVPILITPAQGPTPREFTVRGPRLERIT